MKRCFCSHGCMTSALSCIIGRSRDLEIPCYLQFFFLFPFFQLYLNKHSILQLITS